MKNIVVALLFVGLSSPAAAQSTFHGNVARTGVYQGGAPATLAGIKWSFNTGGPIVGSPAVADGVVYIASLSTFLYAIDQQTGEEKWKFQSSMPIASSPAVADGLVYFVSSRGSLAAIDAVTGQPRWVFAGEYERKFEAKGLHGYPNTEQTIPDAWDVFTSSPTVANGKVYFGAGDGNLYALDAESGAQKSVFEAGRDPVYHNQVGFQSSPAVVDGVVYVGCRDAHVYAIDALTGRKKWDYPTSKSWVNSTPAVRDDVVYAGTSDTARFMALDAKSGRLRWIFDAKAYIFSSAALAGDLAFIGSHNGKLYAVNTKTGTLAWEFQTEASRQNKMGVLSPDGSLNRDAFAPVFGDFQDMYVDFYRYISVGAIMSSPVVDQSVVYVGSTDGFLYALH